MKKNKKNLVIAGTFFVAIFLVYLSNQSVYADDSVAGGGHISFTGEQDTGIKDPENPGKVVDPGPSPSTKGELRLDFVPQLNFYRNKLVGKDMIYPVNAQLFHDETPARGNFVQVSDDRGAALGWTLQLRQEAQFQNSMDPNNQLNGAFLSLDKSWASSNRADIEAPLVSKDVILLNRIGETYNLAEAKPGGGVGSWSISFGASIDNPKNQEATLTPKVDAEEKAVFDPTFENKQMIENSAITLSVPGTTEKIPGTYTTVLTWILAELP
ncbi:WxL domain-containing protein [Enterococcus crotali]|uniref:WxL domain-containing protein n=1 Tax=Enterococcus crotali TaxID=1453587 RepID=UPI00047006D8|nr:WxL domain-containing protein [Enterococcus crotali]